MNKLTFWIQLVFLCAGCASTAVAAGCKSTTQSTPQSIYSELVDGNCLQKDDSGLPSVQAAFTSDAAPQWFLCLKDGGTIGACGVPCDATTVTVIPNR